MIIIVITQEQVHGLIPVHWFQNHWRSLTGRHYQQGGKGSLMTTVMSTTSSRSAIFTCSVKSDHSPFSHDTQTTHWDNGRGMREQQQMQQLRQFLQERKTDLQVMTERVETRWMIKNTFTESWVGGALKATTSSWDQPAAGSQESARQWRRGWGGGGGEEEHWSNLWSDRRHDGAEWRGGGDWRSC